MLIKYIDKYYIKLLSVKNASIYKSKMNSKCIHKVSKVGSIDDDYIDSIIEIKPIEVKGYTKFI